MIGAAVGVVGSLMATAAIRHLARIGRLEPGRLLLLDLERGAFDWVRVEKDRGCPVCSAV